ncbi:hypothetical protein C8258_21085 [Nocardia sp. MDA0666]|uniref:effector-associated constant component EACC1 n=1 Tax=Nocardia sp. MDA0666 TaxID=2135448 RepID=UPI000D13BD55|nr:hypothetical protein [Nocardia sp. MDA0666]PSR65750.1 hypothetical protein C8258_21085 [Nocardia sp. MDA0666]
MGELLALAVDGDETGDALGDLLDWLRDEPKLRVHVRAQNRVPEPGYMGSLMDLAVLISASPVLVALASSLKEWLRQPRKRSVDLRITTEHGRSIEVSAQHADDLERMLTRLLGQQD